MLVDSHAHIQLDDYSKDLDAVLVRARNAGVHAILIIGFDLQTSRDAVNLAESQPGLYATVGMHPHNAQDFSGKTLDTLCRLASHSNVIALGEMGLDYYRNLSPKSLQITAFERQLDLAEELNLPVVIHNREAYHDILPILKARRGRVRGVMHCFSGDEKILRQTLDLGFYIGIGGPVTYRNANDLQTVAREVPADHLLVETDCPWLALQIRRGKRNEPAYVRSTAEKIAELRRVTLDQVAEVTTHNFERLFRVNTQTHS